MDSHQHNGRARRAIGSHGSLDRQRNDRLGRQRFEHRRQILRRCRGSDAHANAYSDLNRDSYADGNSNCNRHSNTHGYANGHTNSDRFSDGNGNSNAECHAEVSTNAAAAPDTGTAALTSKTDPPSRKATAGQVADG